jgi:anti-sigma regulatory factor (Ser/Thr protein kinase)
MWRFDATPRRVAWAGPAPGLLGATAVEARDLRAVAPLPVAPLRDLRTMPANDVGRLEIVVASGLDAPATARAAVAAWLSPQVADQVLNDAQLVVSELVTNSVRHAQLAAGATVRVSVEICDGFVRLEVEDAGDVAIGAVAPNREQGGGFGLFLVETLAQRWGSGHDGTTCVWAELAIAPGA